MKASRIAVCLAICSFLMVLLPVFGQASSEMIDLLDRAVDIADAMEEEDYTIVHILLDRVGLGKDSLYIGTRMFYSGNDYLIVGLGGEGIKDLDIEIYDERNNLVDEDKLTDNQPEVYLSPKKDSRCYVNVILHSLVSGYDKDGEYYFCYIIGFK